VEGVRNIADSALNRNFKVEILCVDSPSSHWIPTWTPIIHAVGPSAFTYGFTTKLDRWLEANLPRFDAVVVNGIWMYFSFAVWKATRKVRVPYFVFIHGALDPWFEKNYPLKHLKKCAYWAAFEHKVLRDASAVLFTTEEEKKLAHNAFQPYEGNAIVTGYGIAAPPLNQGFNKLEAIRDLTAANPELRNRNFILFLARLHEKKGLDLLLKAFSETRNSLPETALVIAGPGDRATLDSLKQLSKNLGIQQHVIWSGPLYGNAKWDAMRAAEAYILPSHQENFGISVVESLACGTPVLISNKVNIWREVQADDAGLVEPDTIQGTTSLLQRWTELPEARKNCMSRRAVECFTSHFEIKAASLQLFNLMDETVRNRHANAAA
jgi:glycosyltransferase involved in cell wall biosynthesis